MQIIHRYTHTRVNDNKNNILLINIITDNIRLTEIIADYDVTKERKRERGAEMITIMTIEKKKKTRKKTMAMIMRG